MKPNVAMHQGARRLPYEHDQPVLQQQANQFGIQRDIAPATDWRCATHRPSRPVSTVCTTAPSASVRASLTKASSNERCLVGASVIRIVQSAKRKVSSLMVCPRRCPSRVPLLTPLLSDLLGHPQQKPPHR